VPDHEFGAPNLLVESCPSRQALDLIANKCAVLARYAVGAGISRHGGMHRQIEGITRKMLTQTLRELEGGRGHVGGDPAGRQR
jgi:DNA-binding HxlR family transcriptional regulator